MPPTQSCRARSRALERALAFGGFVAAVSGPAAAAGCVSAPPLKERSFDADGPRSQSETFAVTLVAATYGPRSVAVRIRLHDRSGGGLTVDVAGVLFRSNGVEMSPSVHAGLPATISVPAGGAAEFTVHYPIGRALEIGAQLVVRGIRSRFGPAPALRIPVPGPPRSVFDERDLDTDPDSDL